MKEISQAQFDMLIEADELSVILCSTNWCPGCRVISPILEDLSSDYGNVSISKVDVDKSPNIAENYGIRSIPAILFLKSGKLLEKAVGVIAKTTLKKIIESHV